MKTNIKIFLLCPVPDDQKPINEFIGLKENLLTSWTTLSHKNYKKKLTIFFRNIFIVVSLITCYQIINNTIEVQTWFLYNLITTTLFIIGLLLINIFRWTQVKMKFENAQLFYEEGSWYMGQIWQKPLPIIKNDKLIVTQKVIPLLNRIFQTSIFFINFFTFLLILTQI